jgi:glycosyltransferase involved in cell wall biosynthesis
MKVLFVCNEVSLRNGWGVINYYTILEAVKAGLEVHVLTDDSQSNLPLSGVTYHPVLFGIGQGKKSLWKVLKSFFYIKKLIVNQSFDVIHVLVEPYLIYFSLLKHKNIVLSLVGTYSLSIIKDSSLRLFYKLALKNIRRFLSISHYTGDTFNKYLNRKYEYHVVPLGVDVSLFNTLGQTGTKELSFTFVGHLKERKGLVYAIKAVSLIKDKYPSLRLYVIGLDNNEYALQCKELVKSLNCEGNVLFEGFIKQDQLMSYYGKSLCNILPSVNAETGAFEGFGLIHLEANASSILTIGSKNCGNESAIIEGVTGFLVEQKNFNELADRMENVIKIYLDGQYSEYAKNCYQFALKNSWSNYFSVTRNYYDLE